MAYPAYIPTRTVTIGDAIELLSSEPVSLRLKLTASRPIVWSATGLRLFEHERYFTSAIGSPLNIVLPRTDVSGYRDGLTGDIIDVSADGAFTHTYNGLLYVVNDVGRPVGTPYPIGPFALPAGAGAVSLERLMSMETVAGDRVSFEVWYKDMGDISAAAASAVASASTATTKANAASSSATAAATSASTATTKANAAAASATTATTKANEAAASATATANAINALATVATTGSYLDLVNSPVGGWSVPVGTIHAFAGASAPTGYLLCNGQLISRTTYAALFALIGTTYGNTTSSNFRVPNLLGSVPVGLDSSQTEFNGLGKTGGTKTHTLAVAEIPPHAHQPGNGGLATGAVNGTEDVPYRAGRFTALDGNFRTSSTLYTSGAFGSAAVTSGQPHNNLQPYLTLNFIIKAVA